MKDFKKFSLISLLSAVFIAGLIYTANNKSSDGEVDSKPIEIPVSGSFEVFQYNEFVDEADVVALVEIKDELSENNSTVVYQENTPLIQYHYATREAEVLEYYKNDLGLDSNIKFNEPAAITEKNEFLRVDEYTPFQKNQKYIVYLSKNNALNELSVISGQHGLVNIDDFSANSYIDIAVKSILKADGINLSPNAIIEYEAPQKVNQLSISEMKKVTDENLDLPISYYFDENTGVEHLNIDGVKLTINEPAYSKS